jgi:hypothetical protein
MGKKKEPHKAVLFDSINREYYFAAASAAPKYLRS